MATKKTNGGDSPKKKGIVWTVRVSDEDDANLQSIIASTKQQKQFILETAILNGMKTVREVMAKELKEKATDLLNQANAIECAQPSGEGQQRKKL